MVYLAITKLSPHSQKRKTNRQPNRQGKRLDEFSKRISMKKELVPQICTFQRSH